MACHILHKESSCITTLHRAVLMHTFVQLHGPTHVNPAKGIIETIFYVVAHTHDTAMLLLVGN